MPFRRIPLPRGLHLACFETGPWSGAVDAPPLVLIHGIGADRSAWALTLPLLAVRRRVLAFDLLGHGSSDRPEGCVDYRLRLLADTLVCGIERAVAPAYVDVIGHSLGGAVALELARHHPRLVRRLVLVDAASAPVAGALEPIARSLAFVPRSFAEARRLLSASVFSKVLGHPAVAFTLWFAKGRRRNRPQLQKLLASVSAGADVPGPRALSRIPHPALVLWGAHDRILSLESGRRLARELPRGRLAILPRCGHVPPSERPLKFVRCVERFLA